jgi:hypothetical protein
MSRHLAGCEARAATRAQAKGAPEPLYHLRAQDAYNPEFWLDLEVRGSARLQDIDSYLRAIWLECCGHLSQFSIGGWRGDEIATSRKVSAVFQPGVQLTHIYDFGTSSETLIKMARVYSAAPLSKHPIYLMARNLMSEATCIMCGRPATHLCIECLYEDDTAGMLCAEHAASHPHEDYGEPIELVNSPRLGMCGYTGPAEPPY